MLSEILIPAAVLGVTALFFGIVLGYAGKYFAIEGSAFLERLTDALPGVNCGACGCVGCENFASELMLGNVAPDDCPMCSDEQRQEISSILADSANQDA
ncbi:MAG: (Fe-S)-binding protein [Christensenellales bacterium]